MATKKSKKSSRPTSSATSNSKNMMSMKKSFMIVVGILFLIVLFVAAKHAKLKREWMKYAGESQKTILESSSKNAESEALVISSALSAQVNGKPFYKSTDLQNYVSMTGKQLNRDIVVVDTNKKILADTVPANVGKMYVYDMDGQIMMTLKDGYTRSFVEKSSDYPNGLDEVVVPLKDGSKIVGVVILSSDTLKK